MTQKTRLLKRNTVTPGAQPCKLLTVRRGCVILALSAVSLSAGETESVDVLHRGEWAPREVLPLPEKEPAKVRRTVYGGELTGEHEGTGYFRVEQADGRWWFIDPGGGRFISKGLNSVNPRDEKTYREEQGAEPLDPAEWAGRTRKLIKGAGFNTLAAWSADRMFAEADLRMPYTRVLHLASAFGFSIGGAYARFGNTGFTHGVVPLFHPDFASFCEARAAELVAETRDDPWLIGYFSDNELPFRHDGILEKYLSFPEEDANHREARQWLESAYGRFDPADITDEDDRAFAAHVIETYFRIVGKAIRKAAPNHLVLGSRFHGMALHNDDLFRAAGPHVDVISVNYYHRWDVETERLASWTELSGRPLLITEFYARRIPGPEPDGPGAGFRVRDDRARGLFYRHFVLGLADVPGCIGWHLHRFSDYAAAGEGITQGIVRPGGEPHAEVLSIIQETHEALRIR